MIDKEQRRYAAEIATYSDVSALSVDIHEKARVYGMLAHVLRNIDLATINNDFAPSPSGSISGIMDAFSAQLKEQCKALSLRDNALIRELDKSIRERTKAIFMKEVSLSQILLKGINTAVETESVTLHTIQSRIQRQEQTISRRGLIESQRVPFKLAMLHISATPAPYDKDFYEYTLIDVGNDRKQKVKILNYTLTPMTAAQGLELHANFPMRTKLLADEPHLGCPVTLIKDFVRDFHTVAADAAIGVGAIPVTD